MSEHEPAVKQDPEKTPAFLEINEYLEDAMSTQLAAYRSERLSFLVNLDRFAEEAKSSALEQHAKRLAEEFRESIDVYLLQIFKLLDLRNNPEALGTILSRRNTAPWIKLASAEERQDMGGDTEAAYRLGTNTIYFPSRAELGRAEYPYFRHVFIHELIHGWISGGIDLERSSQLPLEEAITEFFAFSVTGIIQEHYGGLKGLAAALYDLDRDMLVDWYCLRNDDVFLTRLESNLRRFHPRAEAEGIARQVVRLVYEMRSVAEQVEAKVRVAASNLSEEELKEHVREAQTQAVEDLLEELAAKIRQR